MVEPQINIEFLPIKPLYFIDACIQVHIIFFPDIFLERQKRNKKVKSPITFLLLKLEIWS